MRSNRLTILLLALAVVSLCGCSFQHRSLSYDRPVGMDFDAFEAGAATVDDVLAVYGPPAELSPSGEGYAFRYLHVREKEFSFRAFPLLVTRLGFFGGGGTEATRVMVFDGDGVLQHVRSDAYPTGEGLGGQGGFIGTPQPPFWRILFHDETEEMHGPPPLWGATLLRTSPLPPSLPER